MMRKDREKKYKGSQEIHKTDSEDSMSLSWELQYWGKKGG